MIGAFDGGHVCFVHEANKENLLSDCKIKFNDN